LKDTIRKALDIWRRHAIEREGYRRRPYLDTVGKLTIGIGHLILPEDNIKNDEQISKERVEELFQKDTAKALAKSIRQMEYIGIKTPEFLAALISANFQLGDFSVKFKNSYELLKEGKYDEVIENLRRSLWMRQTPVRVKDFIKAIEIIKGDTNGQN
jgi:lysozyme